MENITFIREILLPPVLEGTLVTLKLIVLSIPLGLILGILIAVGRVYGNKFISSFCTVYTLFFRGTPLLIQLFILYFGFPSIGIFFSPFAAAVIGFILCSGAYHSEYIRGAIQSIKIGQMMAAEALGMTRSKAILYIILPQALRRAIPGCSNEIIYLIKYSSLAFMVTCVELTGAGKIIASRYFEYTLVFLVVGAIYLLMVSIVTKVLNTLEKKLEIPGLG
ncbi:L-cystine transport system permease protein YecS [subsurface metagenome]|uniref:ABC transmembrane type-1 domain-containing protein n=1 Tax=marine sediment metagenome TaxID=412755 RepID=X0ZVU0_9ZZZZ